MTAPPHQFGVVTFVVYRLLRFKHRGRWFEGNPEIEFFTVGNSALDPAGSIRFGSHMTICVFKEVIVLILLGKCLGNRFRFQIPWLRAEKASLAKSASRRSNTGDPST